MVAAPDAAPAPSKDERGVMRGVGRLVHALFVLAVVSLIVVPNIPSKHFAPSSDLAKLALKVSFKQGWQMYSPNPQRSQTYMNLTAIYADGSERRLEESAQENVAWNTHWMWNKTRVDIWRQYANFNPKKRNTNRTWYLKGVCVREARRGPVPHRIVMHQVRRRFTKPHKVAEGAPALGKPKRTFVTVQYCKHPVVLEMIEADQASEAHG